MNVTRDLFHLHTHTYSQTFSFTFKPLLHCSSCHAGPSKQKDLQFTSLWTYWVLLPLTSTWPCTRCHNQCLLISGAKSKSSRSFGTVLLTSITTISPNRCGLHDLHFSYHMHNMLYTYASFVDHFRLCNWILYKNGLNYISCTFKFPHIILLTLFIPFPNK